MLRWTYAQQNPYHTFYVPPIATHAMPYPTPEAAETAFYAAFEARSLGAMMDVWASDDSIVCIHPLAAPLNGRAAVAAGWRSMFEAAGQFRVQVEAAHQIREATQVVRIVREYLVIGQETEPRPPILATNVYRKDADGWRMVLHHASPLQVGGTPPSRTPPVVLH
ncbi:YybH family protein [Thiobacillus denitrificans]|uniref:YybH family protein n=1 Tax=Thiobacillus denitrificans TaxID=36861 RepID=UPI00036F3AE1|nr:nuclear transport factor 2 family protein [Thiobacillus denitrificans]